MRLAALGALLLFAAFNPAFAAAPPKAGPIQPKRFSFPNREATLGEVLKDLEKQTGLRMLPGPADVNQKLTFKFDKGTFWEAAEAIARQTGTRIVTCQDGKYVALAEAHKEAKPIVALGGAFRVQAEHISARSDLASGRVVYELTLGIAWEPRFPVYRMDDRPRITKAEDDAGRPLTAPVVEAKRVVSGFCATAPVTLEGLTRKATAIRVLEGHFTVTATDAMLTFTFPDLALNRKPLPPKMGVTATLSKFQKQGRIWTAEMELRYPPGGPVFESFESWLLNNRIDLVSPSGKRFTTDDFEIVEERGQHAVIRYRFTENAKTGLTPDDLKGWSLEYETPAPLREVPVQFRLENIPLP